MYYEKTETSYRYGVSSYTASGTAGVPLVESYAYDALKKDKDAKGNSTNLESHVQQYLNKFKTVDLAVTGGGGTMSWFAQDSAFGGWRSKCDVRPEVFPRLDTTVIGFSCTQEFEPFWDKITGNQIVSLIDKAASAARMFSGDATAAIYVPAYQKMPVLKGIGTLECMSSVKFNFEFGQAGLYNALEEVVKPVIAIAKSFMPYSAGDNGTMGNAPSIEYALNESTKTFMTKIKEMLGIGKDEDGTITSISDIEEIVNTKQDDTDKKEKRAAAYSKKYGEGKDLVAERNTAREAIDTQNAKNAKAEDAEAAENEKKANQDLEGDWLKKKAKEFSDKLSETQNLIYDALNDAAKNLLGSYTGVSLRIGRFKTPSMIVKDVKFDFDFEEVDENGFPSKGSVELGGLESVKSAYSGLINSPSSQTAENGNDKLVEREVYKNKK
jgi:hypothetical protein